MLDRQISNSKIAWAHLRSPQRFRHAAGPLAELDVFSPREAGTPLFVFIHGGTWRFGTARDNAYPAETFVDFGVHFVVPDFSPVQDHDGDLRPMIAELRSCIVWLFKNAKTFEGDPDQIYLGGFSSGGHLSAVLLTTDWTEFGDLPADVVKGGIICSGMYELEPVALSARRHYVNFTPGVIRDLSPQRNIPRVQALPW